MTPNIRCKSLELNRLSKVSLINIIRNGFYLYTKKVQLYNIHYDRSTLFIKLWIDNIDL